MVFADLLNVPVDHIFDLRKYRDLCEFESFTKDLLEKSQFKDIDLGSEEGRITMRSLLIGFYAKQSNKSLVIGLFKQREREDYKHAVSFADSLDLIFPAETIYCVKDISIISNVKIGGDGH